MPAGTATVFELAIRFHEWADQLRVPLTADLIKKHWGVSRATSYRWLSAYNAARARYDLKEAA